MKYVYVFMGVLCFFGALACTTKPKDKIAQNNKTIDSLKLQLLEVKKKKLSLFCTYAQNNYQFNGNVLIAEKGTVLLKKSYGIANLQQKTPLASETIFPIAALTQGFTAAAILQLAERNKLRFDDTLGKYYPNFPYPKVQIQHLLRQTSGIPDYLAYFFTAKGQPLTHAYKQNIIDWVLQEAPRLRFPTQKAQAYSSTNYILLADIVERVSGVSFGQYLQENIWSPLEMKHTYLKEAKKKYALPKATGYYADLVRLADESYVDYVYGDVGIYSTTEDLYKWEQSFYVENMLSSIAIKQFSLPTVLENKKAKPYSIAGYLEKEGAIWVQRGTWLGFSAYLCRSPDTQQTVIILSNIENPHLPTITEAIYAILQNMPYKS